MMDLRQLTSFVATARAGTYAAAATRLHLAQPAVWKHVRTLEAELGVSLFERVGRRVRLTAAGALVLERAEQLLEGAGRIRDLALDLREGRAGTVTIGCVAPHVIGFLAPVIGAYRRAHPGVRIVLRDVELSARHGVEHPFTEALQSGTVDVVTGPPVPGADTIHAYDVYVTCAVPPRHPWRKESAIEVERLRDCHLLTAPAGYFSRRALDTACEAAGFEPLIEVESGTPTVLVELGRQGLGIPVVASDSVPARPREWPVVVARDGPLTSGIWLSSRESEDPAVAAFVALAGEMASGR